MDTGTGVLHTLRFSREPFFPGIWKPEAMASGTAGRCPLHVNVFLANAVGQVLKRAWTAQRVRLGYLPIRLKIPSISLLVSE